MPEASGKETTAGHYRTGREEVSHPAEQVEAERLPEHERRQNGPRNDEPRPDKRAKNAVVLPRRDGSSRSVSFVPDRRCRSDVPERIAEDDEIQRR